MNVKARQNKNVKARENIKKKSINVKAVQSNADSSCLLPILRVALLRCIIISIHRRSTSDHRFYQHLKINLNHLGPRGIF